MPKVFDSSVRGRVATQGLMPQPKPEDGSVSEDLAIAGRAAFGSDGKIIAGKKISWMEGQNVAKRAHFEGSFEATDGQKLPGMGRGDVFLDDDRIYVNFPNSKGVPDWYLLDATVTSLGLPQT